MDMEPMTVQRLVIEDFPRARTARELSPNGRAHWTAQRAAKKLVATVVTFHARAQDLQPMHGFVTIRPQFIYPIARHRDDDNLATGTMKAVRDCLVRGGWLEADDTDHLRQMPVDVRVIKGRRALVLDFEALACES
jgi:hypothetical protein